MVRVVKQCAAGCSWEGRRVGSQETSTSACPTSASGSRVVTDFTASNLCCVTMIKEFIV
ncbi:hypothetical protein PI125_g7039 [Phytophthora idaei]|nr:hypothetical protein PI125_g7039 [Phytophthora idaei]